MAVAFREEGVDWNIKSGSQVSLILVAFREEGVDWNSDVSKYMPAYKLSPSVRKVWIEI